MADSEYSKNGQDNTEADVEMETGEEVIETVAPEGDADAENGETEENNLDTEAGVPAKRGFIDYLRSPVVEIIVGSGDEQVTLNAHQALLIRSPYLQQLINAFTDASARHQIKLEQEDVSALVALLEWLYTKDYFPTLIAPQTVEEDPSIPKEDNAGAGLLHHARIYTLAQRFGLPVLAKLAHKKIHCTQSNAPGEVAYARYVYANTKTEDTEIRRPIAQFWASRSHILRHQAESGFRLICIDFPEFAFDVLSLVLDAQERRSQKSVDHSQGAPRKRARMSGA